jgi:hypothetical protein
MSCRGRLKACVGEGFSARRATSERNDPRILDPSPQRLSPDSKIGGLTGCHLILSMIDAIGDPQNAF